LTTILFYNKVVVKTFFCFEPNVPQMVVKMVLEAFELRIFWIGLDASTPYHSDQPLSVGWWCGKGRKWIDELDCKKE